jgi:hypothetical protein
MCGDKPNFALKRVSMNVTRLPDNEHGRRYASEWKYQGMPVYIFVQNLKEKVWEVHFIDFSMQFFGDDYFRDGYCYQRWYPSFNKSGKRYPGKFPSFEAAVAELNRTGHDTQYSFHLRKLRICPFCKTSGYSIEWVVRQINYDELCVIYCGGCNILAFGHSWAEAAYCWNNRAD